MKSALLIVDMINTFDYEGARALLAQTRRIAPNIVKLRARVSARRAPVIYCNDNFGAWRSDFKALVAACTADGKPARELVQTMAPTRATISS